MVNLNVNIGELELKNPVMTASGTFGNGLEFTEFLDLNLLGGVFLKGITLEPRQGNAPQRMAETASGMLNAVGLQNPGIDFFIKEIFPQIKDYRTQLIPNVNGSTVEDYIALTEKINEIDEINAIELNISCPNVKAGGMLFGTSCPGAVAVTNAVRKAYDKTLIVKLSPNVTDISEIAKAVVDAGADAVSLINTLVGMAIDAEKRKPILSTITGGLSGPAIKPVALRMVYQVTKAVKVPVIGIGGIMNATDAIEFLLAGASAIQVGTANFIDPQIPVKIMHGIEEYLENHGFDSVTELIGQLDVS